jgi:hypothetical protein
MLTLRLAGVIAGLLLASACQSSPAEKPAAAGHKTLTHSASATNAPVTKPTAAMEASPVLVGLDQHWDSPSTVVLMRPDGSIIATRTLPGTWVVDEHAIGAYLLAANDGSHRAWTVDASGTVTDVASAAAAILGNPNGQSGHQLILDSTTAVTVLCAADACTAEQLNLRNGAVRELLTVARHGMRDAPLQVLDVASDGQTVWLREASSSTGGANADQVEIVGVDLRTSSVSTPGRSTPILADDLAITPDGTSVAGREFATVGQNAVQRLHVASLDSGADADLQGTAELASGSGGSRWVLFAPGAASIVWWGPLDFGPPGGALAINVTTLHGTGRTLWRAADTGRNEIGNVLWLDPKTVLIQTDSTTTSGTFRGSDLRTFTIDTTTGAQRAFPKDLHYLVAVLH